MKQNKVLIAEDEPTILRVIKTYFEKNNFIVFTATDGEEALSIFQDADIDIIILDIMMPKVNGFEVAKRIRSSSSVPIIVMTALGEEQDMLKGYSLKVDDYIVKPFSPKVLVAKVENLLSRVNSPLELKQDYQIGELVMNFIANSASIHGKELSLSKTEFSLLAFFVKNEEKACSRALLLDEIWGMDVFVDNRIIDTYIKTLRKQLKPYDYIKTVFGVGYKFSVKE